MNKAKLAIRLWFLSWLGLLGSLVGILSLGFLKPDLEMKYLVWELEFLRRRSRGGNR